MIFSSTLFLFLFLPASLVVYGLMRRRFRNIVLLLISLVFYYYGEAQHIYILFGSIIINYVCGLLVALPFSKETRKVQIFHKLWLVVCVVLNLGMLGYFKYFNFAYENIQIAANSLGVSGLDDFWGGAGKIVLPLGISFFTFQAMSYVIDVYRGTVKPNYNPINVAAYIVMFPQLIAGPIVRYTDVDHELKYRNYSFESFSEGIFRFSTGMAKKLIIADSLGVMSDRIFSLGSEQINFQLAWYAAICYTFQIYFDFSGYSDMAIGLGKMFGFNFPENFNYPYISRSIKEFWRRWHMTLSSWFRDYLYIPLGGNRKGKFRTYINLLIVFGLCGLWHGAEWVFLIWGLWHGLFLILERTRLGMWIERLPRPVQHLYTIFVFVFGWVLFKSVSMAQVQTFFFAMIGLKGFSNANYSIGEFCGLYHMVILCLAFLCSLPILPWLTKITGHHIWALDTMKLILGMVFLAFSVASLMVNTYTPFLYFRF